MATDNSLSTVVGAYEAKTHFSELLQRVEQGQEVTITRHGSPIARLVPMAKKHTPEERREAIARMRELNRGLSLGRLTIKSLIAEGRR
jgi:prevent-host-death family protein